MNKELFQGTLHRLKPRNTFLTYITEESERNDSKQRNSCVSLLRKSKSQYFKYLSKETYDNKSFWKKMKSLLSVKVVLEE